MTHYIHTYDTQTDQETDKMLAWTKTVLAETAQSCQLNDNTHHHNLLGS